MIGDLATFQDIIDYAEVIQAGVADTMVDGETIENIPDEDYLNEILNRNLSLNGNQAYIVPLGKSKKLTSNPKYYKVSFCLRCLLFASCSEAIFFLWLKEERTRTRRTRRTRREGERGGKRERERERNREDERRGEERRGERERESLNIYMYMEWQSIQFIAFCESRAKDPKTK